MGVAIWREWIPWVMAAGRAALGPVLVVGAECGWNGVAMAGLVAENLMEMLAGRKGKTQINELTN